MSSDPLKKQILVIDDDDAVRGAFRLSLAHRPYELLEADNGETGAEMAIVRDVDLVFLDLRMPRLNGVGALRRIRAVKPDLLIYIVTAFHREFFDELVAARDQGLQFELMRKPLERQQIIELADAVLDSNGT
jgi:DNA-binding NtrC family response regulator